MSTFDALSPETCGCWETLRRPSRELLAGISGGPFAAALAAGDAAYEALLTRLRRDEVSRPAIFIGSGTCGLGAGAAKTLTAVRKYLEAHPEFEIDWRIENKLQVTVAPDGSLRRVR